MAGALLSTTALAQRLPDIDAVNFQVNEGCSGTLIDASGLILTANHCVNDQYKTVEKEVEEGGEVKKKKVRVLKDGTVTQYSFAGSENVQRVTYVTRLVATDKDHDLGLMKIVSPLPAGRVVARFACAAPARGDLVSIVGNPMGILYASAVVGIVSSTQRNYQMLEVPDAFGDAKAPLMQVSGGVVGGNSGGSVWNANGDLVGVPVLAYRVNEVIGFAVPLSSIKTFLDKQSLGRLFAHCDAH